MHNIRARMCLLLRFQSIRLHIHRMHCINIMVYTHAKNKLANEMNMNTNTHTMLNHGYHIYDSVGGVVVSYDEYDIQ